MWRIACAVLCDRQTIPAIIEFVRVQRSLGLAGAIDGLLVGIERHNGSIEFPHSAGDVQNASAEPVEILRSRTAVRYALDSAQSASRPVRPMGWAPLPIWPLRRIDDSLVRRSGSKPTN